MNIKIRETIPTKSFLGFVFGLIVWMALKKEMVIWGNFSNNGFQAILWILGYALFYVLDLGKANTYAFVMNLFKILVAKDTNLEEKFQMLMSAIQTWLGVAANISMIIAEDEKKEKISQVDSEINTSVIDLIE